MAHWTRPLFIMLALSLTLNMGCSEDTQTKSLPVEDEPDDSTPVTPPTVSTSAPFAIKIGTKYDGISYLNQLTFTETGTDTCSASTTTPVVTCTVAVPEGQLYYSGLNFNFSWMASKCMLLTFTPYQYMASNAAAYTPPGATDPVDCTADPVPTDCYGGVASEIVPDYPNNSSIVYLPDLTDLTATLSKSVDFSSAYSKKSNSNRHAVNDLPVAKRGTSFTSADLGNIGDGYVANSYSDYKFTCKDSYYDDETYSITINVTETNSASGNPTVNHIYTWAEAP